MPSSTITVTAAIVKSPDNNILFAQRKATDQHLPHKWEFPGGKQELNEPLNACLIREIKEEFDLKIFNLKKFLTVDFEYPFGKIILHSFTAECESEKAKAHDHQQFLWLKKNNAHNLDFAPADIPIYNKLLLTNWP